MASIFYIGKYLFQLSIEEGDRVLLLLLLFLGVGGLSKFPQPEVEHSSSVCKPMPPLASISYSQEKSQGTTSRGVKLFSNKKSWHSRCFIHQLNNG